MLKKEGKAGMASEDMEQYLKPTPFVDWDTPAVLEFAREHAGSTADPVERAVRLYYAVRDGMRYDPYDLDLTVEGMRASATLAHRRGWCVTKACLLAACLRAVGVPARLGYADVRNHLTTARMRDAMKTDVFYYHGYTSIFLNGQWLKATPAFNVELCSKFRIRPLEFDGTADSIYHPLDLDGNRHMEYLQYRGEHADLPLDLIIATFLEKYPVPENLAGSMGDFDKDVDKETSGV
jgi:transglutaminase-like putative cysteine protease